jgi:hypothetical protein
MQSSKAVGDPKVPFTNRVNSRGDDNRVYLPFGKGVFGKGNGYKLRDRGSILICNNNQLLGYQEAGSVAKN